MTLYIGVGDLPQNRGSVSLKNFSYTSNANASTFSSSVYRFSQVAELRTMSGLEIHGKIRTKMLSPNTKYGAYLIMKISNRAYGLDLMPSEISVQILNSTQACNGTAYLRCAHSKKEEMEGLFYGNRREMLRSRVNGGDGRIPYERGDGWMELELGDFFNGEDDVEVTMSLREVKGHHLKGGLVVEGIEVRPKCIQEIN